MYRFFKIVWNYYIAKCLNRQYSDMVLNNITPDATVWIKILISYLKETSIEKKI